MRRIAKPFFPWVGGKLFLLPYIFQLLPRRAPRLLEVCGGSGAVTLGLGAGYAPLRVYNDLIKKAAQEKQVAYLDLYSEFVNENGELPAEASKDGVHLRSDWCKQWLAYLQTHTVDFDTLYPTGEQPQV